MPTIDTRPAPAVAERHAPGEPAVPEAFRWESCYLTGLRKVDEQHHHLVDVLNRFGELLVQPEGVPPSEAEAVFQELERYAREHFAEEERLMRSVGVDARHVDRHCAAHRGFAQEVARLHGSEGAGLPLLKFMTHWLTYHILGMDHGMATQVRAIGEGAAPAHAYQIDTHDHDPATRMLLRSLHSLFVQVSERNRALHELNRTLEMRVEERTHALSAANRQLEALALTDSLTGLPNRRAALRELHARWQETSRRGTPLACLVLDADGFKAVNDVHGHDAGDAVLRELGWVLQGAVRTDDLVCRMGGDEFLVVCPATPLRGAQQVAEKLCRDVAALRVRTGDGEWRGSVSVGVAVREPDMAGVDALLKAADRALYAAKAGGRNCVMAPADAAAA